MMTDRFQYVLDDFGNFENLVKIWTVDLPNITKIFQRIQDTYEFIIKNIIFISENLKFDFLFGMFERRVL